MNDLEMIHQYLICEAGSIDALEDLLYAQPQTDIPVKNSNINGMYVREITIPKDNFITGRVHLFDYVDIMLSGDITIATEDGPKRFSGHHVFHGKAGKKRAGYAHEETKWVTVHNWDSENGDDFYNKLTCLNMSQFNAVASDRKDYIALLGELSWAEKDVSLIVQNTNDMVELSEEFKAGLKLDYSFIDGVGLFAQKEFNADDVICPSLIDGCRTWGGRYSNHSLNPNSKMVKSDFGFNIVATSLIKEGEEITTNYRHTLNARGLLCLQ